MSSALLTEGMSTKSPDMSGDLAFLLSNWSSEMVNHDIRSVQGPINTSGHMTSIRYYVDFVCSGTVRASGGSHELPVVRKVSASYLLSCVAVQYRKVGQETAMIKQASEHTSTHTQQQMTGDVAGNADFALVVSRVAELQHQDEEDEIGGATEYAVKTTLRLLTDTAPLAGAAFSRASASTTVERGVHVYWKRAGRTLQLSIPSSESGAAFIYHRHGQEYAVETNISAHMLANWLYWFNNA